MTSFTPAYGAPEQFSRSHGATGPWTDVFSFALIVAEVITGKAALEGDSFLQLGYTSADPSRRPTPRALGASVSDEVEAVFLRALAVYPAERYPALSEFWNALREALRMQPMRAVTAPTSELAGGIAIPPAAQSNRALTGSLVSATSATQLAPASASSAKKWGIGLGFGLVVAAGAVFALRSRTAAHSEGPPTPHTSATAMVASPLPLGPACPTGMIEIPGGKFFMGSDDDLELERPAHNVTLAPYCIDQHEVTVDAYKACSDIGECKRAALANDWQGITDQDHKAFDPLCNIRSADERSRHPINCIDWEMADRFCKAQKKRLPTEAEWEFAARGPDGRKYPWGDELPSSHFLNACGKECIAWGKKNHVEEQAMYSEDDGWANTAPVGSFPAGRSRYGVDDVVGNVWEWVADLYAPYSNESQENPHGPEKGEMRVIRGGAWNGAQPSWVRPTFRYRDVPTKRSYGIGFRCAK